MGNIEHPLYGGLENRVVRVGSTVRRPAGEWTSTVQGLLGHLQKHAFPAPTPLGLDDQGREVVSYLPGMAALRPWPPFLLSLEGVRQVARLLRHYHDAVAGFVPITPIWRHGAQALAPGEIVLHGDFGPYNLIFEDEHFTGVIDWDLAHPGLPIEDAAYAAVQLAPLRPDALALECGFPTIPDRHARLEAFAHSYGGVTPRELIAAAKAFGARDLEIMHVRGNAGLEPWKAFMQHGLAERTAIELAWLNDTFRG